jgi:hypothetical protein
MRHGMGWWGKCTQALTGLDVSCGTWLPYKIHTSWSPFFTRDFFTIVLMFSCLCFRTFTHLYAEAIFWKTVHLLSLINKDLCNHILMLELSYCECCFQIWNSATLTVNSWELLFEAIYSVLCSAVLRMPQAVHENLYFTRTIVRTIHANL